MREFLAVLANCLNSPAPKTDLQPPFPHSPPCLFFIVEAGADKEIRKKSAKKVFEINFDEDVNFEPYFRETRVCTGLECGA